MGDSIREEAIIDAAFLPFNEGASLEWTITRVSTRTSSSHSCESNIVEIVVNIDIVIGCLFYNIELEYTPGIYDADVAQFTQINEPSSDSTIILSNETTQIKFIATNNKYYVSYDNIDASICVRLNDSDIPIMFNLLQCM